MSKNEELMDAILSGEDDPILPDGWQEGDDLFAEVGGDVDAFLSDGAEELTELPAENEDGNSAPAAPTTDGEVGEESQSDEAADKADAPDGEGETQKRSRKLKLKVNHAEEEIDVDAMSDEDLVALLQKGRAFDQRMEADNKQKYRQAYQEQLDAGMTEEVASLIARDRVGGKSYPLTDEPEAPAEVKPAESAPAAPVRDIRAETQQLQALYPDLKEIPDEVVRTYAKGIPLLNAYLAYRDQQSAKTAASLHRENQVLKQNAASAAKAPVRGVSGGGVAPKKVDNFLAGFDSDPW